jgi:hypothetical protein
LLIYAAGLNLLDVDKFIATSNIDHATVYGKDLDRRNFVPLGEDAVPVIVARLDELDPINRRAIEQLLYHQLLETRARAAEVGWQSANLSRWQALALLELRVAQLAASCATPIDHPYDQLYRAWGSVESRQERVYNLQALC